MTRTIVFANQKGGVAKTTSTINTASALEKMGKKVLLVDMDPQGDLTDGVGVDSEEAEFTVYEVMKSQCPARDAIVNAMVGSVLVGSIDMSMADQEFNQPGREQMLKEALCEVKDDFDFVLIDTPPALGFCTINAMTAADFLVIPSNAAKWSNKAITKLNKTIGIIHRFTNPDLKIAGVLITNFFSQTVNSRLHSETAKAIGEAFGFDVFQTSIRRSVAVEDAQTEGRDLLDVKANSKPAEDYVGFAMELMEVVENG